MTLDIRPLGGAALAQILPDVAALRMSVFRDWPYLYDGDSAYEARYLAPYVTSPQAIVVGAFCGDRLVGASTGMPLSAHADGFAAAFAQTDLVAEEIFYCAESVLLPDFRGRGAGHAFFDHREAAARRFGFTTSAFCAVVRPDDHPARPHACRSLSRFWLGRGYRPLQGVVAQFSWTDIGDDAESEKPLQFWARSL